MNPGNIPGISLPATTPIFPFMGVKMHVIETLLARSGPKRDPNGHGTLTDLCP